MVWSSAQPKNVGWMVERTFGQHVNKLTLVWTREQMGLSKVDYARKTRTTKDLSRIWEALGSSFNGKTTILLDDSPSKARLQPYNHICVEEYVNSARGAAEKEDDLVAKLDGLSLGVDGDDETLLAVIGILDCIKGEDDVAEWVKGGGLSSGKIAEVLQWYTDPNILHDWAKLGKQALGALHEAKSIPS
ncbi:uncharacterized protein BT62DRAFT_1005896 [Guyanagaster necrorhizus]|uniref:FCP1 homology domain-containing protein n=1 Tax=Guyanagaster necrorhizus TaxID=856835 RepID=A0A9P7VUX9_9AGAR|nr:uncharacterized protein BT62DRAFT_1005896 [Guyanagaster necrorhizus MCA 3950]KAG7446609.1 hypothetical protein BT62DRAFT_1005896 [Guyanagaster necrorhizus MCA 3950]